MDSVMQNHMNAPWHIGTVEWVEMAAFWIAGLFIIALFVTTLRTRSYAQAKPVTIHKSNWRYLPEVRMITIALPLELLWEIAQFPLYDVWHQNDWSYILYGLAHCTLGDLLILLVAFEFIALINMNRHWHAARNIINIILFTGLGVGYTIFSEIMNVRIKGTWGYTELMPLIPGIEVGGMPFLQWLLIPPLLLWFMNFLPTDSKEEATIYRD